VAALDARPVDHDAVGGVLVQHLTFQDPAVLQGQMKNITLSRVWHGIEPYGGCRTVGRMQAVPNAPKVAVSAMQPPDTLKRLALRHDLHLPDEAMQRLLLFRLLETSDLE
jgi:hypothetical protein